MGIKFTIDMQECCQMAGLPYEHTYSYEDTEDDGTNYLEIRRVGDIFTIDCYFRGGWRTDAYALARLFEELRDDIKKIAQATRTCTEMKRKKGDCTFVCTQKETVYVCDNFIVTMRREVSLPGDKIGFLTTVEDTTTHARSEHMLAEMNSNAAATAIKLHLAEVAEIAEEKA